MESSIHVTFLSTGRYGTCLLRPDFPFPDDFGLKIFLDMGPSGKQEGPSISELAPYRASVSEVFSFSSLWQLDPPIDRRSWKNYYWLNPIRDLPLDPIRDLPLDPIGDLPLDPIRDLPLNAIGDLPLDPIRDLPLDPIRDLPLDPIGDLPLDPIGDLPLNAIGDLPLDHIRDLPLDPIRDLPLDPIGDLPLNAIGDLPLDHIRDLPLDPIRDLPLNAIGDLPLDPIRDLPLNAIGDLPLDPIRDLPLDAIGDLPLDHIRDLPLDAINPIGDLPLDAIGDLPLDPIRDLPLDPIGDLPLNAIGDLPLDHIRDLPLDPIRDLPLNAIGDLPLDPIRDLPLNAIGDLPLDPIRDLPLDAIGDLPLDHIRDLPLDAISSLPTSPPPGRPLSSGLTVPPSPLHYHSGTHSCSTTDENLTVPTKAKVWEWQEHICAVRQVEGDTPDTAAASKQDVLLWHWKCHDTYTRSGDSILAETQTRGAGACDAMATGQAQVATVTVVHTTLIDAQLHCVTIGPEERTSWASASVTPGERCGQAQGDLTLPVPPRSDDLLVEPVCPVETLLALQQLVNTDPDIGSTTMSLGCPSPSQMRTPLMEPSRLATSILPISESVQYSFLVDQSTANPVGVTVLCKLKPCSMKYMPVEMLTLWLPIMVEDVDVHGKVEAVADHFHVVTRELVGPIDAFCVPVCPVQLILKKGQGKRVGISLMVFIRTPVLGERQWHVVSPGYPRRGPSCADRPSWPPRHETSQIVVAITEPGEAETLLVPACEMVHRAVTALHTDYTCNNNNNHQCLLCRTNHYGNSRREGGRVSCMVYNSYNQPGQFGNSRREGGGPAWSIIPTTKPVSMATVGGREGVLHRLNSYNQPGQFGNSRREGGGPAWSIIPTTKPVSMATFGNSRREGVLHRLNSYNQACQYGNSRREVGGRMVLHGRYCNSKWQLEGEVSCMVGPILANTSGGGGEEPAWSYISTTMSAGEDDNSRRNFTALRDGNHTMFREYTFIHQTPHNRASFVKLFWKCYRQIGKKGGTLLGQSEKKKREQVTVEEYIGL
ncbi:CK049-like protein [Mya arenaria]|uniref:CK049-like protein n=1 Tax=Mya arenaria TaxID=6604 RepID=A0ABY7E2H3_MYAAR|nr:CK049-like protein [Mya arenaria]